MLTNLDGTMLDSLAGTSRRSTGGRSRSPWSWPRHQQFSGAVLGPEARRQDRVEDRGITRGQHPARDRSQLVFSTLASAYNGLIANPLFTGVLGSELVKDADTPARTCQPSSAARQLSHLARPELRTRELPSPVADPAVQPERRIRGAVRVDRSHPGDPRRRPLSGGERGLRAVPGAGVERAAAGVVFSIVRIGAPIVLFSGETRSRPSSPTLRLRRGCSRRDRQAGLLAVAFKSGFSAGRRSQRSSPRLCRAALGSPAGDPIDVLIGGSWPGSSSCSRRRSRSSCSRGDVQADAELTALIVLAVAR
jgi:hypothetical protein